ncbi:MAG: inositol monophosphatase [Candidatus Micrarchaeota archaeon]|nr:inositol monophosphatase [Candidatus Micrarchaeota archaeon]
MASQLIAEKRFALSLAREAGQIIKENFASGLRFGMESKQKVDKTLVTKTDTDINDLVIKAVKKEFPDHDILGEEKSDVKKKSKYTWVCDPLDGTSIFTYGIPLSVFSLALVRDGVPVTGVVNHPYMNQIFSAEIHGGAYLNGNPISVSKSTTLERSAVGMAYWRSAQIDIDPLYHKLYKAGANILQLGSIAYMGALVSNASIVASIHPADMPYDSAALKVIIEEANGKVTDLYGNEQSYDGAIKGCIMSNGSLIHDELVRLFRE